MVYVLSKLLVVLITPSVLVWGSIGLGLLVARRERWRNAGLRIATVGFLGLIAFGYGPIANWLAYPLETRFSRDQSAPPSGITDIVVLGGFEEGIQSVGRGQLSTNAAGERIAHVPTLARRYPDATIVLTGGVGGLVLKDAPIGSMARDYLVASGVAPDRIVLEDRSRTTWENARLTRALLAPRPDRRILLVTSAFHMPRAVGTFRAAGFAAVEPWPVDYRGPVDGGLWRPFTTVPEGLWLSDTLVKEWAGVIAYWLTGRSDALFPGPSRGSS